jgi:hypothetical protein
MGRINFTKIKKRVLIEESVFTFLKAYIVPFQIHL